MEGPTLVLLIAVAIMTSTLSAIIGLGGGILLLAVMFTVEPSLLVVVPLHGAVQLTSNASRVVAFRKSLVGWISGAYALGGILGAGLAWVLLDSVQKIGTDEMDPWLKLLVSLYIFFMLFKSHGKRRVRPIKSLGFGILGVLIVPLSSLLGATGPLLAPFFIRDDLKKEEVIVSKASCQVVTHTFKLIIFSSMALFSFGAYKESLICLMGAAVVGTYLGKYLTRFVDEELFRKLYKIALFVAGIKIFVFDAMAPIFK